MAWRLRSGKLGDVQIAFAKMMCYDKGAKAGGARRMVFVTARGFFRFEKPGSALCLRRRRFPQMPVLRRLWSNAERVFFQVEFNGRRPFFDEAAVD